MTDVSFETDIVSIMYMADAVAIICMANVPFKTDVVFVIYMTDVPFETCIASGGLPCS